MLEAHHSAFPPSTQHWLPPFLSGYTLYPIRGCPVALARVFATERAACSPAQSDLMPVWRGRDW